MNTLKEALELFDNPEKKKFYYFEVSDEISKLPTEIRSSKDAIAELLAMGFQDNTGEKHWNTYYGPMSTWVRKDNGEEVLCPDRDSIKPEHISHWEERAGKVDNPLLRMRYLGLVHDFKQYVTGVKASFKEIIKPYLQSIIEVVEGEYMVHEFEGYVLMERVLNLSAQHNQKDVFEMAQDVLWNYDHKHGKDESPGLWGRHFKLMIKHIDKYNKYEAVLLKENEDRFARIEEKALEEGGRSDNYTHILEDEMDLLCEYYHIKRNPDKIRVYLDRELAVIRKSILLKGGVWGQSMLQTMQVKYRKYHFYKEANKLFIDIQDLGDKILDEMEKHEFSVPLDKPQLDEYMKDFLSGAPHEVFLKYIVRNIPNMEIERQRQKEEAKQSPLLDMMRTTIFDLNGSPISNIGAGKDPEHQKLMYGMYRRMQITSIFLRLEVTKMIEQGILSFESIINEFNDSPLIIESQRGLVEKGVKAYFDNDYIVACHLLIPQFESAIRRLVALCGGEVLKAENDPNDGNIYISLEGLLNSDEAKEGLKEDIQTYFKNLFTDHNGWNLRNLTCHGLKSTDSFNATVADRVVHAFAILSQIRFKEK